MKQSADSSPTQSQPKKIKLDSFGFYKKICEEVAAQKLDINALQAEAFKDKLVCIHKIKLLQALENALQQKNAEALEKILADNWAQVKGSLLCYTACPEDSLTILLCDLADSLSEIIEKPAINLLMPTIQASSDRPDLYPNLDGKKPAIKEILKTHILSNSGDYLIPIGLLSELTIPWHEPDRLFNYYYQEHMPKECGYITNAELERLFEHSSDTQALANAKAQYEKLVNDKSLLGHLNQLISALSFNSVEGIGSETHAGERVYGAIIRFSEFYNLLEDEQKNKIPESVKEEIDKILTLSSDASQNSNATENIDTCIATRRNELNIKVKNHEVPLSVISVGAEEKAELLVKAKDAFRANQNQLRQKLENCAYGNGCDRLGMVTELLECYQLIPTITSQEQLKDFMSLSAAEVKQIAEKYEMIRAQMIEQISSIELFVLFCHETSIERLEAVLSIIGKSLLQKLIDSADDLSATLISLEGERLHLVCNVLREKLPDIIQTGLDFEYVVGNLSPEQCTILCEAVKEKLPDIIKNGYDFGCVSEKISPEQRTTLYEAMKEKLPDIITSVGEFECVLCELNHVQRTTLCEAVEEKLPDMIKTADDFGYVLENICPKQRTTLYEAMKEKLPDLIETVYDFQRVFQDISPWQRTTLYETLKEKLPGMIKTSCDFRSVLSHLNPEQRIGLCESLKGSLPDILKDVGGFIDVLPYLNPGQCTTFCEEMKEKLPDIIRTFRDFARVLCALNAEQHIGLYESLKESLPDILKDGEGFIDALYYLNPALCTALCETLKEKLPDIIKTSRDFRYVLEKISPEQRTTHFETMKEKLPGLIKTGQDFGNVLTNLSPGQRSTLYETLKEKLPDIIKTSWDFRDVLFHLNPEQRIAVYEQFQGKLPELIKTLSGFQGVLYCLEPEQCERVFYSLKITLNEAFTWRDALRNNICIEKETAINNAIARMQRNQEVPELYPARTLLLSRSQANSLSPQAEGDDSHRNNLRSRRPC